MVYAIAMSIFPIFSLFLFSLIQTFGKKKTATAVAHVKAGKGLLKVNGCPITLVQPEILRFKVYEPLVVVGLDKFANVDIRVRVTGGGHVSQVYAIRQAIAKGLVAYHQKYVDEQSKNELKKAFVAYDRTLLIADARRMEPKKFGGRGARARFRSLTVTRESETERKKREERKGTVFIGSHPFFLFLLVFFISFIPFQSHISTLCVIKYVPFD